MCLCAATVCGMTDTTEVTGADFFEVRKLKGMSQTEVAKKVSYSTALRLPS